MVEACRTGFRLDEDDFLDVLRVHASKDQEVDRCADLYEAVRAFVAQRSVQGAEFSLMFEFKKGDFINFEVIPENTVTDHDKLYMQKVDGKWIAEDLGSGPPVPCDEFRKLF